VADGINLAVKATGADKAARDLKKVGRSAKGAGKGFKTAGADAAKMGAALKGPLAAGLVVFTGGALAATAALAGLKRIAESVIAETFELAESLDTVTKKAQSIGATNRDLQLVTNAFSLFGVEAEQTQKSMQRLNQSMGEAMLPDAPKTLLDAFERLGVGAAELSEMPLADRLVAISTAFESYSGQATRGADANKLFGRSAKDALVAFGQGAQAMRGAIADVERYGIASDQAFKSAEDLLDAQLRLNLALTNLKTEALTPLMKVMTGFTQALADTVAALPVDVIEGFAEEIAGFAEVAIAHLVGLGMMLDNVTEIAKPFISTFQMIFAMKRWDIEGTKKYFAEAIEGFHGLNDELQANQDQWTELGASVQIAIAQAKLSALAGAPGANGAPGAPGDGKGNGKDDDGTADRVKKQLDEYREYYAELQVLQQEAYLAEQERMRMLDEQRRQYLASSLDATRAGITAVGDLAGSVSTMVTALYGQNSAEAKKAAKAAFLIQKMAAIAEATVNLGVAISEAAASAPPPANIPAIIAASVIGGAAIASIVATTIAGVADAGLPPGALRQAGLNNHTVLAVRRDEMVLDPKGTQAITEMLQARQYGGSSQPVVVNTRLELDGRVLGETVDDHLVRSSERGLNYQSRIRYGKAS